MKWFSKLSIRQWTYIETWHYRTLSHEWHCMRENKTEKQIRWHENKNYMSILECCMCFVPVGRNERVKLLVLATLTQRLFTHIHTHFIQIVRLIKKNCIEIALIFFFSFNQSNFLKMFASLTFKRPKKKKKKYFFESILFHKIKCHKNQDLLKLYT